MSRVCCFIGVFLLITGCTGRAKVIEELHRLKAGGTVSLTGNVSGSNLDIEFSDTYGILNSDYIALNLNPTDEQLSSIGNINGISLDNLDEEKLGSNDTLSVSEHPKAENEISVELDIAHACGGPVARSGQLIISNYNKESIAGSITLSFSDKEFLAGSFDVPLWNNRPEIPGEYRLLSDEFPDTMLNFGEITLEGTVKGLDINDTCNGKITLDKITLEIDAYTNTALNKIEIECFSPGIDMKLENDKEFKLSKNNDDMGFFRRIRSQFEKKRFYAEWEDYHPDNPYGENSPVEGTFRIQTLAQNGISGTYDIKIFEKDGTSGHVSGRFKLPIN